MPVSSSPDHLLLRPLTPDDLDAVVAIDRAHTGSSRLGFYQKRLQAALRDPKAFVYVGAAIQGRLVGFVMARLLGGEFGHRDAAAALDAIGVDPDHQGRGVGRALMAGLDEVMRSKGVRELETQSEWTDYDQLRFFAQTGFRHAPRIVLERDAAPLQALYDAR